MSRYSGAPAGSVATSTTAAATASGVSTGPRRSAKTAGSTPSRAAYPATPAAATSGSEGRVIDELGLDPGQTSSLSLGRLTDAEVDELIRGYGFHGEAFRGHVIAIAEGNPRVVHLACQLATDQNTYLISDTVDILERFVAHSRRHLDRPPSTTKDIDDERQAVAVAVAALAGARRSGRTELAALGEAINCLPTQLNDIAHRLNDLVEAGLVEDLSGEGRTHVLRPKAAGAVVLAAALRAGRVRVDPAALLRNLGQHTAFADDRSALAELGLPRPDPEGFGLHADVQELAEMLGVLAQRIHLADLGGGRALLRASIAELITPVQSVLTWIDVLSFIGRVAPAAPQLIADLRDALVVGWPPEPVPPLWSDTDPNIYYRQCLDRLLKTLADQVPALNVLGPDPLMGCVLDAAWLAYPALGLLVHEHIQRAASALSTTRISRGADSDAADLARRAALHKTIVSWLDTRTTRDPDGLAADERDFRPREITLLLACRAVGPLPSLLTEELGRAPADPNTLILMHKVLEDGPATAAGLSVATDTVIELLDRLLQQPQHGRDLATFETAAAVEEQQLAQSLKASASGPGESLGAVTVEALTWIVDRPAQLVAESARGLGPNNTPLPTYAFDLLRAASDRLAEAVAARWHELPLVVRHHAARSAVIRARTGQRPSDAEPQLGDVAGNGDPIGVRAVHDDALADLLTIKPVDDDLLTAVALDEGMESAVVTDRRRAAQELGASQSLARAVELLELAGQLESSSVEFVAAFATAVGENLNSDATQDLLDGLIERRFYGDVPILTGALQRHRRLVGTWLLEHASLEHPDLADLALQAPLPADLHQAVCDRIVQDVLPPPTASGSTTHEGEPGQDEAGPANGQSDIAPAGTGSSWSHSAAEQLAYQAARALARPVGTSTWRLQRLSELGLRGPLGALDQVLVALGHVLGGPSEPAGEEPEPTTGTEVEPAMAGADASPAAPPRDQPAFPAPDGLEPKDAQALAGIVERALADPEDEDSALLDQQRGAFGVIALLRASPEEMASLLYRRAHSHPHAPIPAPWRHLIAQQSHNGSSTWSRPCSLPWPRRPSPHWTRPAKSGSPSTSWSVPSEDRDPDDTRAPTRHPRAPGLIRARPRSSPTSDNWASSEDDRATVLRFTEGNLQGLGIRTFAETPRCHCSSTVSTASSWSPLVAR